MAMLPQAPIIIARRDRLETCFGCYRYPFSNQDFTHDFADLAAVCASSIASANSGWSAIRPGYANKYTKICKADPEAQIRQLLAFCDLPFEESC